MTPEDLFVWRFEQALCLHFDNDALEVRRDPEEPDAFVVSSWCDDSEGTRWTKAAADALLAQVEGKPRGL